MQNSFFYCTGPLGNLDEYPELPLDGEPSDPPLVVCALQNVQLDEHRTAGTLRRNWRRTYDVSHEDDLDHAILKSGTEEGERYRSILVEYLSRLVTRYRQLGGNVFIVPGPFDLLPGRIGEICKTHGFQEILDHLESGDIDCQFLDDRTIRISDSPFSITGIPHRRTTVPDLPEQWYRPGARGTEQDSVDLKDMGDIIVSANGFESDQSERLEGIDRYPPVSLERHTGANQLLLDGCTVSGTPFDALGTYRNLPRIHGQISEIAHGLWSVDYHPNEVDVRLFERGVKRLDARYDEDEWTLSEHQSPIGASDPPSERTAADLNEQDGRTGVEEAPGPLSEGSRGTFEEPMQNRAEAAGHEEEGSTTILRSALNYARRVLPTMVLVVTFLAISVPVGVYFWDWNQPPTPENERTRPELVQLTERNIQEWVEVSNALAEKIQQNDLETVRSGTPIGFSSELRMRKQLVTVAKQICDRRNVSFQQFLDVTRTIGIHWERPSDDTDGVTDHLRKPREQDDRFTENRAVFQKHESSIRSAWKKLTTMSQ